MTSRAEAETFLASLPIYVLPVRFEQRALGGYGFDWEKAADGSCVLLYRNEDDITPMHVVTDYARAFFDVYGEPRRSEWTELADRALWTINRRYSDPYGEAFGAACAVLLTPDGPVPVESFFRTTGLADEVRAFVFSLIPTAELLPAGESADGSVKMLYDTRRRRNRFFRGGIELLP